MFNLLVRKKFLLDLKDKDRFSYIKPTFNLLCDINRILETTDNFQIFSLSEMYLDEDLLIVLAENGTLFFINIIKVRGKEDSSLAGYKKIIKFCTNTRVAKSIALNKSNNNLLIVYLTRESSHAELKCCSIELNKCKKYVDDINITEQTLEFNYLFSSENLSSPAFVEFDEINNKIITRNSLGTYKIWNMKDYKQIFELTDRRIEEIRTAEGILMTIKSVDSNDKFILTIYDVDSGRQIINYEILLYPQLELEILEIFDNVLLLKQVSKTPILLDLFSQKHHFIKNDNLDERSLFMFVSKFKMFISLNENMITFYSLKGEVLRCIKNEKVTTFNPNCIHMSFDKRYLILYWEERNSKSALKPDEGSKEMNSKTLSNILNLGMCLDSTSKGQEYNISKDFLNSQRNNKTPLNNKIQSSQAIDSECFSMSKNSSRRGRSCNQSSFNFNTSIKKFFNSNFSKISFKTTSNLLSDQLVNPFFKGEFEIISLQEDPKITKFFINTDNSKFINRLGEYIENEIISYFTFSPKTMRLYCITQSGKLIECSI